MKLKKINSYKLEKCYSIGEINYNKKQHIIVAAEKTDNCVSFDSEGNFEEIVWEGPSGTMSIVPLPEQDGCFLATKKMYSPNDSMDAEIVLVKRVKDQWHERIICKIPCAHRFDVLTAADGKKYFISGTIKNKHEYRDDWRFPGQILVSPFPSVLDDSFTLTPTVLIDGLLKNHGYSRRSDNNGEYCVIASDKGVMEIHPPIENTDWTFKQLTTDPTSDIAFVDFKEEGSEEMVAFYHFHGDVLKIYSKNLDGTYHLEYTFLEKYEFLHSIWGGVINNKPTAIVSNRKGKSRDLMELYYENGKYNLNVLDRDCGSTNVAIYDVDNEQRLVSANREIDEVAFYKIEE